MTTGIHVSTSNPGAATSVDTSGATRTTTAGSTVVVCATSISDDFAASNPLTDSKSNTWTQIATQDAGGRHSRVWYSKLTSVGAGHYWTVNLQTAAYAFFGVVEILDGASTPTVAADHRDDQDGTPWTTTPGVSPAAACQIVGFASLDIAAGADTHTWGSAFAAGDKIESETDGDNRVTGSIATAVKGAGTYNSSITSTGTAADCAMWIVSVLTTAGGGSTYNAVPQMTQYRRRMLNG